MAWRTTKARARVNGLSQPEMCGRHSRISPTLLIAVTNNGRFLFRTREETDYRPWIRELSGGLASGPLVTALQRSSRCCRC